MNMSIRMNHFDKQFEILMVLNEENFVDVNKNHFHSIDYLFDN